MSTFINYIRGLTLMLVFVVLFDMHSKFSNNFKMWQFVIFGSLSTISHMLYVCMLCFIIIFVNIYFSNITNWLTNFVIDIMFFVTIRQVSNLYNNQNIINSYFVGIQLVKLLLTYVVFQYTLSWLYDITTNQIYCDVCAILFVLCLTIVNVEFERNIGLISLVVLSTYFFASYFAVFLSATYLLILVARYIISHTRQTK